MRHHDLDANRVYETGTSRQVWEVPVIKDPDYGDRTIYYVHFRLIDGDNASCTCPHGQHNFPATCKHVRMAKAELRLSFEAEEDRENSTGEIVSGGTTTGEVTDVTLDLGGGRKVRVKVETL